MASPILIGGKGYRWRGRSIRTITRNNSVCVSMSRKDSMVMVPCAMVPNTKYKVTITASKNSGNGALLVNFFGGKHYDGKYTSLHVESGQQKSYIIGVESPNVPDAIPMYFRIWKPNDATGTVFIKDIEMVASPKGTQIPVEPKPQKIKTTNSIKNPLRSRLKQRDEKVPKITKNPKPPRPPKTKNNKRVPPPPKKIKENSEMKFRPSKPTRKRTNNNVDSVIVRKPDDVPKVSIITPTREGAGLIKMCYEALNKNTCYPNWEWIVGDSDSSDGTVEYLKGLEDSRIKIIERGTTDGSFSSINNELAKFATGEYYLFLNNDTEPQAFWLFEMMSKIFNNQDVGIVGAKLLYPNKKIQHAGIAFIPQGPANIGKSVLGSFPEGFADQDRYYQAVTGACLLISAKDFDAVGGFDPVYYFCYEDVDLCLKVGKKLKKKILYAANSVLIHHESSTQKKHKTAGGPQKAGIEVFKKKVDEISRH